jgi:transcriptional regulator with XRE-family HTH domain
MYELMNRKEIMKDLAKKIKQNRISLDLTQEEFSKRSGVKLSTYRTFERSGKGSLENFIAILLAFGMESEFEKLFPKTSISPKDLYEGKTKKIKMRVKKSKKDIELKIKEDRPKESFLDLIKKKNACK